MLQGTIEALKDDKITAALKAINDEKNKEFHDRDLYVSASACSTGILPPTKVH